MASSTSATDLGGKRVLLAEDEPLIAMLARSAVEDLGGTPLECATSPEAAIGLIQTAAPDLVILDIHLGGTTSERVLNEAQSRGLPVLVSSGSALGCLPEAFRDLPLLAKPWGVDEFAQAIAGLFEPGISPA